MLLLFAVFLGTDDHPPLAVPLKYVRVAVVRRIALLRALKQRRQLPGGVCVFPRGGQYLVGFAVIAGVFHVAGVKELKTAGHSDAGARVAAVRIVARVWY